MAEPFVEAIVFDCDGVLVDSEVLGMTVGQRVLADLGWQVEVPELIEKFMGSSHEHYVSEVEKKLGRALEPGWDAPYRAWYEKAYAEELREIEGISAAIERISLPMAVASNSRRARIESSLRTVGLYAKFAGSIASAEDVPQGKPAPDVYLKAAEKLGVAPERCLAVEDSRFGVQAALSAGMSVFAHETELTPSGWFEDIEVTVFHSMADLPDLVRAATAREDRMA